MVVQCEKCNKLYDDHNRWTICPHGPLYARHDAYCPKHDLVDCVICKSPVQENVFTVNPEEEKDG